MHHMNTTSTTLLAVTIGVALVACSDGTDEAPVEVSSNSTSSNATTSADNNATSNATTGGNSTSTTGTGTSNTTTGGGTGTGGGTTTAPPSCTSDDDCTDSLTCTTDTCSPEGFCIWTVQAETCLINNVCHASGAARPNDPCQACQPDEDTGAWTMLADDTACDDGNACTMGDRCQAGACEGGDPMTCDDGNACTDDTCEPALGCVFSPSTMEDAPCDDNDVCTTGDTCTEGLCLGRALDCNDDDVCTDDICDPEAGGCTHTFNTAPCEDGNACTAGDLCTEGVCVPGGEPNCDDGNICTIDGCDERAGCFNLPSQNPCCIGETSICDDGDPCTTDNCDPETGACLRTFNNARCDDNSLCTTEDICNEGACVGQPLDCDDGNACTDDACNDSVGCVPIPLNDTACNDGFDCTTGDICTDGLCLGDDSACVCEPDFFPTASRFTTLAIGEGGRPGQSLDLDNDPNTCSPPSDCEGGINNSLGLLAGIVNPALAGTVADGSLVLLLEFREFDLNPFTLAVYDGRAADNTCDTSQEVCDYLVGESLLDRDTCAPVVSLPATLSGDTVTAGGSGTIFPFQIPLGGALLSLTLYEVQLEGTVVLDGDAVQSVNAVLAGAVRREELLAALSAVPEDDLPFPPDTIASLLDLVVVDDIDTNGDGMPDAASIGIRVEGIGANLVGVDR